MRPGAPPAAPPPHRSALAAPGRTREPSALTDRPQREGSRRGEGARRGGRDVGGRGESPQNLQILVLSAGPAWRAPTPHSYPPHKTRPARTHTPPSPHPPPSHASCPLGHALNPTSTPTCPSPTLRPSPTLHSLLDGRDPSGVPESLLQAFPWSVTQNSN